MAPPMGNSRKCSIVKSRSALYVDQRDSKVKGCRNTWVVMARSCQSRGWAPADDTRIHCRPCPGNRPERHFVALHLQQHERAVLIEPGGGERRGPQIASAQLATRSGDEIRDPFLGFEPFVDVLVAGKHDA